MPECKDCNRTINDMNDFTCVKCKGKCCGNDIETDGTGTNRNGVCAGCGGDTLNKKFPDREDVRFEEDDGYPD